MLNFDFNIFGGEFSDEKRDAALLNAAASGNVKRVLKMIEAGASPDTGKDSSAGAALHRAARKGYLFVVKALVEKKADVNLLNYNGRNALLEAIKAGKEDVALYLLEQDSTMNLRDRMGNNAMDAAIANGMKKAARKMIEKGFNTEEKNRSGDDTRDLMARAAWDDHDWDDTVDFIDIKRHENAEKRKAVLAAERQHTADVESAIKGMATAKRDIAAPSKASFKKRPKHTVFPHR